MRGRDRRRRRQGALRWLPMGLILPVALTGGCERRSGAQAPPPPTVTVSHPVERDVIEWDEYIGRLEAVESVDVRARVSGFIDAVHFEEGKKVQKEQLLFTLDPRPFDAELDRAKADVARADAELQHTAEEVARLEPIRGSSATDKEYKDQLYAKRAAEAAKAAAKAAERTAQLNREFTEVKAPIAGQVSRRLVTRGNLVNGGAGQATLLTTITSLDPIHCYVDADERAVLKYQRLRREGGRVSARDQKIPAFMALSDEQDGDFPHEGVIDFVDNRLEPGTGTLQARASIPNPGEWLTPGLFARLRVPGSAPYHAVLVSDQAVRSDQGRRFVMVVGAEHVAEVRPVKAGALFDGLRAVEGVRPDEWVIVNGLQRVRPGVKVDPKPAPMPARASLATTRKVPPTQPASPQPASSQPASSQPAGAASAKGVRAGEVGR